LGYGTERFRSGGLRGGVVVVVVVVVAVAVIGVVVASVTEDDVTSSSIGLLFSAAVMFVVRVSISSFGISVDIVTYKAIRGIDETNSWSKISKLFGVQIYLFLVQSLDILDSCRPLRSSVFFFRFSRCAS
jgi:hypothetical protein